MKFMKPVQTLSVTLLLVCLGTPVWAQQVQTLSLSVEDALIMSLKNNAGLKVERYQIDLSKAQTQEAEAAFDSVLNGEVNVGSNNVPRTLGNSPDFIDILSFNNGVDLSLDQKWATGSQLSWQFRTGFDGRVWADRETEQQVVRLGVTFTQALLQGRDPGVNLALIEKAKLNEALSRYKFKAFAQALVAQTEQAYWDYLLARQEVHLNEVALQLAQSQEREIKNLIQVGKLAPLEEGAAQAEVALRKQALIEAQGLEEKAELTLLRLLNPGENWADYKIEPAEPLVIPAVLLDKPALHIELALKERPEILQAQLEIEQNTLELRRTQDGLLPRLDFFASLGKTGYAASLFPAIANLPGSGFDASGGLQFSYPLGVRQSEARVQQFQLTEAQKTEAMGNLKQLIELDIRQAYIDIQTARQQIDASKQTVKYQQTKLNFEQEKLRLGKSTAFLVAQAQRDLLQSQINQVRALMTYMKRLTTFYRLESTLLKRRGLQV